MDQDIESLERLLRPLRRELSRELAGALLGICADDEVQTRYEELADKNTEGLLTNGEHAELASLVRANALLGLLKAEARASLEAAGA